MSRGTFLPRPILTEADRNAELAVMEAKFKMDVDKMKEIVKGDCAFAIQQKCVATVVDEEGHRAKLEAGQLIVIKQSDFVAKYTNQLNKAFSIKENAELVFYQKRNQDMIQMVADYLGFPIYGIQSNGLILLSTDENRVHKNRGTPNANLVIVLFAANILLYYLFNYVNELIAEYADISVEQVILMWIIWGMFLIIYNVSVILYYFVSIANSHFDAVLSDAHPKEKEKEKEKKSEIESKKKK